VSSSETKKIHIFFCIIFKQQIRGRQTLPDKKLYTLLYHYIHRSLQREKERERKRKRERKREKKK
jgi:hypothetical protein